MTRNVVFCALCSIVCSIHTDVNGSASTDVHNNLLQVVDDHEAQTMSKMKTMTMQDLMHALSPKTRSLLSRIPVLGGSFLQMHEDPDAEGQATVAPLTPVISDEDYQKLMLKMPSLQQAVQKMDDMILEALERKDEENNRCTSEFDRIHLNLGRQAAIVNSETSIYQSNEAKRSSNRNEYLRLTEDAIPATQDRKQESKNDCDLQKRELGEIVNKTSNDLTIYAQIKSIIDRCGTDTVEGALVQKCKKGNHTQLRMSAAIVDKLKQLTGPAKIAALKAIKLLLHDSNSEPSCADGDSGCIQRFNENATEIFAETNTTKLWEEAERMGYDMQTIINSLPKTMSELTDIKRHEAQPPEPAPQDCKVSKDSCSKMGDIFNPLYTELNTQYTTLSTELTTLTNWCQTEQTNFQNDIDSMQSASIIADGAARQALVDARKAYNTRAAAVEEVEALNSEWVDDLEPECNAILVEIVSEICALKQIREKLLAMNGVVPIFSDCKMTTWALGECSTACGFDGVRKDTRDIQQPQSASGAGCPATERVVPCNQFKCGYDCEYTTDWGDWGECDSDCGGGFKERSRTFNPGLAPGDTSCQDTSTIACNVLACNADCKLVDWSDWSSCSQQCAGGFSVRTRAVESEARGNGRCPSDTDLGRLNLQVCSNTPCLPPTNYWHISCGMPIRSFQLIDTSGSLSLDQIDSLRLVASAVFQNYEQLGLTVNGVSHDLCKTNTAVVTFSGPDILGDTDETTNAETFRQKTIGLCYKQKTASCLVAWFEGRRPTQAERPTCGRGPTPFGVTGAYPCLGTNAGSGSCGEPTRNWARACGVQQVLPADDNTHYDIMGVTNRCTDTNEDNPDWQALKNNMQTFRAIRKGTQMSVGLSFARTIDHNTWHHTLATSGFQTMSKRMLILTDGEPANMPAAQQQLEDTRVENGFQLFMLLTNLPDNLMQEQANSLGPYLISADPANNEWMFDHLLVVEDVETLKMIWMQNQLTRVMCDSMDDRTLQSIANPVDAATFLSQHPELVTQGNQDVNEPNDPGSNMQWDDFELPDGIDS